MRILKALDAVRRKRGVSVKHLAGLRDHNAEIVEETFGFRQIEVRASGAAGCSGSVNGCDATSASTFSLASSSSWFR